MANLARFWAKFGGQEKGEKHNSLKHNISKIAIF